MENPTWPWLLLTCLTYCNSGGCPPLQMPFTIFWPSARCLSDNLTRVEFPWWNPYPRADCPLSVQNVPLVINSFEHRKKSEQLESGASLLAPSPAHFATK